MEDCVLLGVSHAESTAVEDTKRADLLHGVGGRLIDALKHLSVIKLSIWNSQSTHLSRIEAIVPGFVQLSIPKAMVSLATAPGMKACLVIKLFALCELQVAIPMQSLEPKHSVVIAYNLLKVFIVKEPQPPLLVRQTRTATIDARTNQSLLLLQCCLRIPRLLLVALDLGPAWTPPNWGGGGRQVNSLFRWCCDERCNGASSPPVR